MSRAGKSATTRTRAVWVTAGVLAAWAIALVVVGVLFADQAWAKAALATGAASAVVVGVLLVRGGWFGSIMTVELLAGAGLIAAGATLSSAGLIGIGVLTLVFVGATAPIAIALRHGVASRGVAGAPAAPAGDVQTLLREIHEHTMLSDNAKRVLFRERELEMLRQTIEHDIAEGKYNAAITLCDEMASLFGYLEDAEAFRQRIERARQQHYDAEVGAALVRFEALLEQRSWAQVHQEAARIRRLYGDSHHAQDLDSRILAARDEHKRELEGRFLKAAERDDVESAMELLKELDRYLDHDEAERLQEVAQGVVTQHRENLGVQFKLAVNDHRWAEAVNIGETIVAEFPNTKMAGEVRTMLEHLRSRAEQAAVSTGQRR